MNDEKHIHIAAGDPVSFRAICRVAARLCNTDVDQLGVPLDDEGVPDGILIAHPYWSIGGRRVNLAPGHSMDDVPWFPDPAWGDWDKQGYFLLPREGWEEITWTSATSGSRITVRPWYPESDEYYIQYSSGSDPDYRGVYWDLFCAATAATAAAVA
jgi:hypothetical protein